MRIVPEAISNYSGRKLILIQDQGESLKGQAHRRMRVGKMEKRGGDWKGDGKGGIVRDTETDSRNTIFPFPLFLNFDVLISHHEFLKTDKHHPIPWAKGVDFR